MWSEESNLNEKKENIYLKAMNASPFSPPMIWTPPSGIIRPLKKLRISAAFADQGRFCSRIITFILTTSDNFPMNSQNNYQILSLNVFTKQLLLVELCWWTLALKVDKQYFSINTKSWECSLMILTFKMIFHWTCFH